MDPQNDQRKKAFKILLAMFLVGGGAVFIYSIYQGLGDMRGADNGAFSYGYAARQAALPLFQYFGLADENDYTRKRGRVDSSGKLHPARPDLSTWMSKPSASASAAAVSAPSAPSAPSAGTAKTDPIPKMAAGTMSQGLGGGGGSKSSSAAPKASGAGENPVSEMGKSQASGEIKLSKEKGKPAPSLAVGGKTMGVLGAVREKMYDSLKSNSAMVASAKWSEAFGAGGGKAGGQTMSYASGSGVATLDGIKGGVGNLKINNPGSLKTVSPPSPTRDKESEGKDSFLQAMQGMGGQGGAQGEENAKEATKQTKGQTDSKGLAVEEVPPAVLEKAYKPVSEGGTFCGSGDCATSKGQAIDTEVRVTPTGDGNYKVDYSGTQSDIDGDTSNYTDSVIINGQTLDIMPAGSTADCNGGPKQKVEQDSPPPGCPVEPNTKPRT